MKNKECYDLKKLNYEYNNNSGELIIRHCMNVIAKVFIPNCEITDCIKTFIDWIEAEEAPLDDYERSILQYLSYSTVYEYIARNEDGDLLVTKYEPAITDCGDLKIVGWYAWIKPFNRSFLFISNSTYRKIDELLK